MLFDVRVKQAKRRNNLFMKKFVQISYVWVHSNLFVMTLNSFNPCDHALISSSNQNMGKTVYWSFEFLIRAMRCLLLYNTMPAHKSQTFILPEFAKNVKSAS